MHVALTGVSAWVMRTKGKPVFLGFSLWAVAIFVSTLSTKQHYVLDIAGGLVAIGIVIAIEHYVFAQRSPSWLRRFTTDTLARERAAVRTGNLPK